MYYKEKLRMTNAVVRLEREDKWQILGKCLGDLLKRISVMQLRANVFELTVNAK